MFLSECNAFFVVMCRVTQPLFVGGFIRYFSPGSNMSRNTAFMYAAAIVICSAVNVIVRQSFMMAMFHLGMKIRVSLCSLLYRKASTYFCHIYSIIFSNWPPNLCCSVFFSEVVGIACGVWECIYHHHHHHQFNYLCLPTVKQGNWQLSTKRNNTFKIKIRNMIQTHNVNPTEYGQRKIKRNYNFI